MLKPFLAGVAALVAICGTATAGFASDSSCGSGSARGTSCYDGVYRKLPPVPYDGVVRRIEVPYDGVHRKVEVPYDGVHRQIHCP